MCEFNINVEKQLSYVKGRRNVINYVDGHKLPPDFSESITLVENRSHSIQPLPETVST